MTSISDPRGPRTSPPPGSEPPAERFSDAMSRADNAHRDRQKHAADSAKTPKSPAKPEDPDAIDHDVNHVDAVDDHASDLSDVADDTDGSDPSQSTNDTPETTTDDSSTEAHDSLVHAQGTQSGGDGTARSDASGGAAMQTIGRIAGLMQDGASPADKIAATEVRPAVSNVQPVAAEIRPTDATTQTLSQSSSVSSGHAALASNAVGQSDETLKFNERRMSPNQSQSFLTSAVTEEAQPSNANPAANATTRNESAARLAVEGSAEPRPVVSPAFARAAEVDAAVRVEQSTGTSPTTIIDAGASATKSTAAIVAPMEAATADRAAGDLPKLDQPQFTGRVLRGLSAMVNQRGGTMTMRLDPPELGALKIHMTITRGMVTAEFQASTPAAQKMLDQSMATLRTALEGQGLNVERLHVHQGATHQQHGNDSQHDQSNHDAGDGQSRGRGDAQSHDRNSGRGDALFDSIFNELHSGRRDSTMQRPAGAIS